MNFINGIEVLDQTIIKEIVFQWTVAPIILLCIAITLFALGIIFTIKEREISIFCRGFIVALFLCVFVKITGDKIVETDKYEYKVLVSESVNFNEFNEKYDLIKQEGKIYIIRLKDDN